jgi:hypothetical protein
LNRLRTAKAVRSRSRDASPFVGSFALDAQMLRIRQMTERCTRANPWTRNRNPTNRDHLLHAERERLEQLKLIELVGSICSDINVGAGELVVESQSYLPPQAILRSFVLVNGNAEICNADRASEVGADSDVPRLTMAGFVPESLCPFAVSTGSARTFQHSVQIRLLGRRRQIDSRRNRKVVSLFTLRLERQV